MFRAGLTADLYVCPSPERGPEVISSIVLPVPCLLHRRHHFGDFR